MTPAPTVPAGVHVRCYERHRPDEDGGWAIQVWGHAGTKRHQWRTIGYADAVALTGVRFVVDGTARQRELWTKWPTVHAFVQGELLAVDGAPSGRGRGRLRGPPGGLQSAPPGLVLPARRRRRGRDGR